MPIFTVERQYLVPEFQHITLEAVDAETAMREALASDNWEGSQTCYDDARREYVTGCWDGPDDYSGPSHPIPADLHDVSQELAGHLSAEEIALIVDALNWRLVEALGGLIGTAQAEALARLRAKFGPDQDEPPTACECDNTHEANDTVCRWCWSHGRRHWGDADVAEA